MKGDFTLKVLEFVGNAAVNISDFFEAMTTAGYGASYGKLERTFHKIQARRASEEINREHKLRIYKRYHNILSWLTHDGLMRESIKNGNKFLALTRKGREKLLELRKRKKHALPETAYVKEPSDRITIAVFDIPEREKRKREWLRFALRRLGFSMLQKSVWIGKTKIPKEFLNQLFELKLGEFVEIFEISKSGSLRHIV